MQEEPRNRDSGLEALTRGVAVGNAPRLEGGLCVLGRGRLVLDVVNPGFTHVV